MLIRTLHWPCLLVLDVLKDKWVFCVEVTVWDIDFSPKGLGEIQSLGGPGRILEIDLSSTGIAE